VFHRRTPLAACPPGQLDAPLEGRGAGGRGGAPTGEAGSRVRYDAPRGGRRAGGEALGVEAPAPGGRRAGGAGPGHALTAGALIRGIAAHDLYHAGQIQLLRRLCRRAGR